MTQLSLFAEIKPCVSSPENEPDRWIDIKGWRYTQFSCLMELIRDMNGMYFKTGGIDKKITYKGFLKSLTKVYIFNH